jgi:hypothetical protein
VAGILAVFVGVRRSGAEEPAPARPVAPRPIESAVLGPDGGVPTHPGYAYVSPFGNPEGTSVEVKVGCVMNSVEDYDIKTGRFHADFFLSLTSAVPMPEFELVSPNGTIEEVNVVAELPTFRLYRMSGTFRSRPDLRRYPFDRQELAIEIEDDTSGSDSVRFVPDRERTEVGVGFEVVGWDLEAVEARILSHAYPERFPGDDLYYGRYIYRLELGRYGTSAMFKVFVPAFVIVIIGLMGMWVPPTQMDVRGAAGAPMLAGAVLFHFALMQELPATSYLTRADKLMMGVYASLILNMLSTWWMYVVPDARQDLVFRIARVAVPVLSAAIMAAACLL